MVEEREKNDDEISLVRNFMRWGRGFVRGDEREIEEERRREMRERERERERER